MPDWSWQEIDGVPWLQGANATFLCRLATEHPGGDHRILVGSIERMFGPDTPATPLLYHGGEYARLAYEETDPSHRPTDRGLLFPIFLARIICPLSIDNTPLSRSRPSVRVTVTRDVPSSTRSVRA
jgi:hypothetical protein